MTAIAQRNPQALGVRVTLGGGVIFVPDALIMRLPFVHARPVPQGFNSALRKAAVDAARTRGHDVRLIDLYAEGFDPVMSTEERRHDNMDGPPRPTFCPIARRWNGPRG